MNMDIVIRLFHFFSVDTIAFVVLDYPMSYIELAGTLFALWSVWLAAKNNVLTWPIGNIGAALFLILFYQIRLYSDTFEQVYYLLIGFYGWWQWSSRSKQTEQQGNSVRYSSIQVITIWFVLTMVVGMIAGWAMSHVHTWLPALFQEPASFPYIDALTTTASFVATWLMAQRRIECWYYWIVVDVIAIWLYFVKDVHLIALLYLVFLVLASNGLYAWLKQSRTQPVSVGLVPQV
jgi:nicotinamide mononucleotide transporter